MASEPMSTAWDPLSPLTVNKQSFLPPTDYFNPAFSVDDMELSAALARYLDNGPRLSEPFTYDGGASNVLPELAYPLLELCGSGPVTIVENNEEHLVALDINDYLNIYP